MSGAPRASNAPRVLTFDDRQALAAELARRVARDLEAGIGARHRASLIVPGGTTPELFFAALHEKALPWSRVVIGLTDERWVPTTDPRSNERLVRTGLLRGRAAAARFVGLMTAAETPAHGEAACERALATLPRPFDAVVLGMGEDGHTASLFPGADGLARALDPANPRLCQAIAPPAGPPQRMTLTLAALTACRHLYLAVPGAAKRRALEHALSATRDRLPIALVLEAAGDRARVLVADE